MNSETSFKPEVTSTFITSADEVFKPIVENIVGGTVDNRLFPISQPKAKLVQERYLVYAPTVVDADKRNSETAAARIAAREPLEAALRELLPAVQSESGGSLSALLTTSIPLARNPETPQLPFTPNTINLFQFGSPLQFFAQCEAQTNAHIYEAQVTKDQAAWPWQGNASKSAVSFSNLPVNETLYVQMRVKNAVGASEWSTPKPFMIPPSGVTIPERKRPRGVK